MAIIKQDWSQAEVEIAGSSLDGLGIAGKVVLEVDNSSTKHIADDYDIELSGLGDGTVDIYRAGSNTAANFALAADIVGIWDFIKSLDMSATKKKVDFRLEQLKQYNALLIVNNTDAVLGSSNTVKRQGADLTN